MEMTPWVLNPFGFPPGKYNRAMLNRLPLGKPSKPEYQACLWQDTEDTNTAKQLFAEEAVGGNMAPVKHQFRREVRQSPAKKAKTEEQNGRWTLEQLKPVLNNLLTQFAITFVWPETTGKQAVTKYKSSTATARELLDALKAKDNKKQCNKKWLIDTLMESISAQPQESPDDPNAAPWLKPLVKENKIREHLEENVDTAALAVMLVCIKQELLENVDVPLMSVEMAKVLDTALVKWGKSDCQLLEPSNISYRFLDCVVDGTAKVSPNDPKAITWDEFLQYSMNRQHAILFFTLMTHVEDVETYCILRSLCEDADPLRNAIQFLSRNMSTQKHMIDEAVARALAKNGK